MPKLGAVVVAAAMAGCGLFASSASAISWWVEKPPPLGEKLLQGEVEITKVKTQKPFVFAFKVPAIGVASEIECRGLKITAGFIRGPVEGKAERFTFETCTANKPENCKVTGGAITTVELVVALSSVAGRAQIDLTPKAGAKFANFALESPERAHCAIEGKYEVRGSTIAVMENAKNCEREQSFKLEEEPSKLEIAGIKLEKVSGEALAELKEIRCWAAH